MAKKINIADLVRTINETHLLVDNVKLEANKNLSSANFDQYHLSFLMSIISMRIVTLTSFVVCQNEYIDGPLQEKTKKLFMSIGTMYMDNFPDDKMQMMFMKEIQHEIKMLMISKAEFFGNHNVIAVNSKSAEHLRAFDVSSIAELPNENYVIKLKNYFDLQVRVGIEKQTEKKNHILKIYDIFCKG